MIKTLRSLGFEQSSKPILVTLLALSSSVVFGADSSTTATANVITPLQITKQVDLAFGDFAPGIGGTVTIATDGTRTATGPVLASTGTTPAAARFDVTGSANSTYSISYSGDTELTNTTSGGSETMALTRVSDLTGSGAIIGTASSGTLSVLGTQSIYLGGSLVVSALQEPGSYEGTITVTVEYN